VVTTRCGNIYGPGDYNFSRIIPDAIRCALDAKTLKIRSDGKFTRDYVYVEDVVSGYILLAENMSTLNLKGEAFNFSDQNPMTVIQIVDAIYALVGKKPDYIIQNKAQYEIKHQYLDSRKARKVLGWKPSFLLSEALRKTIKWYSSQVFQKKIRCL